jgi:hypothetical protein
MNEKEAEVVAKIVCNCDGECSSCSHQLISMLMERFPEHKETFRVVWSARFDMEWEDHD